tara:strand:- start:834 stop:1646 length:813 start_codon:yes stop_codon:yes gene_type:complete
MDISMDPGNTETSNDYLNKISTNPNVILVFVIVIIFYYVLFANLGETTSNNEGGNVTVFMELLLWAVFILLLLLNGMSLFFNMDVTASLKNIFSPSPEIEVVVDSDELTPKVPERKKEVFYIPGNKYSYDNAKALCLSYGGRLATYQEISDAYDQGADWCGYGWSEGQMALFPTQQGKWANLQSIDGHEHDCGRPGINGGYIENPNVRFGVNCYGYKPDITPEERTEMENATLYQKTQKELDFEKRVDYWRSKIPNILLAPFNHNTWSIV